MGDRVEYKLEYKFECPFCGEVSYYSEGFRDSLVSYMDFGGLIYERVTEGAVCEGCNKYILYDLIVENSEKVV